MSRLPNSTQAWYWSGATTPDAVQFGQSGQPRPEPVSRTAAPEMMVRSSAQMAAAAKRHRDPCYGGPGLGLIRGRFVGVVPAAVVSGPNVHRGKPGPAGRDL